MRKLFSKLLNIPVPYVIAFSITTFILSVLAYKNTVNTLSVTVIAVVGLLLGLQMHLGSVVLKSVISGTIILYIVSLYTYLISSIHGYVTQPFLLSLAAVAFFLAQTYDKTYNFALRSRSLWSLVLTSTLVIIKLFLTLSGMGFWITETIGLNVLIIYIIVWRLWINNSSHTKIISPTVSKEIVEGDYKFIHIQEQLDAVNNVWIGERFTKKANAYPYIYNEVMKAHEEGLTLILLSERYTSEIYDLGEIKINNAKKIPYLYMEAKEKDYFDEIILRFTKEITRSSK